MNRPRSLAPLFFLGFCGLSFAQDDFNTATTGGATDLWPGAGTPSQIATNPCTENCPPASKPQTTQPVSPETRDAQILGNLPSAPHQLTPSQQAEQYSRAASAAMETKNFDAALNLVN